MRMVCNNSTYGVEISPESGEAAGDEEDVGPEKDNLSHQHRSKLDEPTNSNGMLVGGIVY